MRSQMSGALIRLAVAVGLLLVMGQVQGQGWPESIAIQRGEETSWQSVAQLRERADIRFRVYDPYFGREIDIRGFVLTDWVKATFGEDVNTLTLTAMDGFTVTFEELPGANWILVTHHDGEAIGLRDKGPLRLIERDYGRRDVDNLRLFNDWIWMIERIEGAP